MINNCQNLDSCYRSEQQKPLEQQVVRWAVYTQQATTDDLHSFDHVVMLLIDAAY